VALNRWFMHRIGRRLDAAGYRVVNRSYPSRTVPIERIASRWLPDHLSQSGTDAAPRLHFVAHSMGTLLVRHLAAHARPANLGRAVFIAPPSRGSELADEGRPQWLFRTVIGMNLHALGPSEDGFWRTLPQRADFPMGIIAGTGHGNPFGGKLPNPNDGTVTLESTQLDGAADSIELPWAHTSILLHRRTAEETLHFLKHGRFIRGDAGTAAHAPQG
jgi:pimeloyl-ACP methyl ester carboxylesterase